jgi:hypothetical protein
MATKFPIEYELSPKDIRTGTYWLTLRLKNVGTEMLTSLDVKLNSLDAYDIGVYGTGSYIAFLNPDEERILPFQVMATATTNLYATIEGWRDGAPFYWESPYIWVKVGKGVAELISVFAMTEPYPPIGKTLRCEASIRGLAPSEGLTLEFWANTPSGDFEALASIETKALSAGEEARYAAEVTPEEKGAYTIYAYLYKDGKRIGRKLEYVYVT